MFFSRYAALSAGRNGEDNAATGGPLNRDEWNLVEKKTANRAIFTTNHLDVRALLFSVETYESDESGERIEAPASKKRKGASPRGRVNIY